MKVLVTGVTGTVGNLVVGLTKSRAVPDWCQRQPKTALTAACVQNNAL